MIVNIVFIVYENTFTNHNYFCPLSENREKISELKSDKIREYPEFQELNSMEEAEHIKYLLSIVNRYGKVV